MFDSQRRVVQITNGTSAVTTYTAWDSSGRPTAGTTSGGTLTLVYNDAARSYTSTETLSNGTRNTGTFTFDANGNQTSLVAVSGGTTVTTTFTITSTGQACK